ncbi:hypothetical protein AVEN_120736-1 [Araneus ventricosus]|uniref:Uncharacterized protein n=1 Tax=Araneus ventricosus TaxID=182803 RepID=A0A4Y2R3H3_ARAVE|nr:hypothetical protein AVEN_120736-1 [Araneus ventricosus]
MIAILTHSETTTDFVRTHRHTRARTHTHTHTERHTHRDHTGDTPGTTPDHWRDPPGDTHGPWDYLEDTTGTRTHLDHITVHTLPTHSWGRTRWDSLAWTAASRTTLPPGTTCLGPATGDHPGGLTHAWTASLTCRAAQPPCGAHDTGLEHTRRDHLDETVTHLEDTHETDST